MRTCDGERALVPENTPDGMELQDTDCICALKQQMECKVSTRLTVILREVSFGGAWLLSSKGWNVAKELPGMVEMVQLAQSHGLTKAKLRMEQRTQKTPGQPTRNFVVPVLQPDVTLEELAAGHGQVGAYNAMEIEDAGTRGNELGTGL